MSQIDPAILRAIPSWGDISVSRLKRKTGKSDGKIRNAIKDYEKRGWIITKKDPMTKIELTAKGQQAQDIII